MPVSLFELILTLVFIGSVFLGLITVLLGFRQASTMAKMIHFGVGASLPIGALFVLWFGTRS